MATGRDHEEGLALFMQRAHRPRFRDSLSDTRLRRKLHRKLHHFAWLDDKYVRAVPTTSPQDLHRMLVALGAPETCWILTADPDLDGHELPLIEAFEAVLHDDDGALISCIPGRLGIYSREAPNKTTDLLERPA